MRGLTGCIHQKIMLGMQFDAFQMCVLGAMSITSPKQSFGEKAAIFNVEMSNTITHTNPLYIDEKHCRL